MVPRPPVRVTVSVAAWPSAAVYEGAVNWMSLPPKSLSWMMNVCCEAGPSRAPRGLRNTYAKVSLPSAITSLTMTSGMVVARVLALNVIVPLVGV